MPDRDEWRLRKAPRMVYLVRANLSSATVAGLASWWCKSDPVNFRLVSGLASRCSMSYAVIIRLVPGLADPAGWWWKRSHVSVKPATGLVIK